MKKTFFLSFSFAIFSSSLFASQPKEGFLEAFKKWQNETVPYYQTIENYPEFNVDTVEPTTENLSLFNEDFYRLFREENVYCSKVQLPDFQSPSIIFLEHLGSSSYSSFYIYTFDEKKKQYTLTIHNNRNLYLFEFENNYYFIEVFSSFDSKRPVKYNIIENLLTNETVKYTIKPEYKYNLSETDRKYISEDIINKIAEQNYTFLGLSDKPQKIEYPLGEYTICGSLNYTSVGYFATTMDLSIRKNTIKTDLDWVWGFNIANDGRKSYLVIVTWQDKNQNSFINDIQIKVFDLDTKIFFYKNNLYADIIYNIK